VRAYNQLKIKVRALPTWRNPVGDGAKRTRGPALEVARGEVAWEEESLEDSGMHLFQLQSMGRSEERILMVRAIGRRRQAFEPKRFGIQSTDSKTHKSSAMLVKLIVFTHLV
jgi:hypothetical protein